MVPKWHMLPWAYFLRLCARDVRPMTPKLLLRLDAEPPARRATRTAKVKLATKSVSTWAAR